MARPVPGHRHATQAERGARMYRATTHAIEITVEPQFLEEQSSPDEGRYIWAYTVEIRNLGTETVQLRNRYWRITDALGRVEEVRGPGVVGKQPVLGPGDSFTYTSGCPLRTPSGFMAGSYEMEKGEGERFLVEIPAFSLDLPGADQLVN